MTLPSGTCLGPYEISSPLGAGGMGEVYRARDTRLDRAVALKILPSHLAASPELRLRFEREAKAISALNHPHICVLHDIGRQDGIDFLVMEYLEGETLADRLKKGPLPLERVLRYGVEIAEALDRAHRQGIVHRDLKPGNVMLTKSGTKLLDFGLAKLRPPHAHPLAASEFSSGPTEEKPLTAEGSIVGTVQYMSPEQLEAKEPDARTDIFALGTVLYEMATGKRAFTGKSPASLIAAILGSDPAPISSLQPLTPPALDRCVATCLAKDPDDRWQSAHDIARELKWIAEGGSEVGMAAPSKARSRVRGRLAWTAAAGVVALLGIALGIGVGRRRESPEKPLQVRFEIRQPESRAGLAAWGMALSPDGERIVFPTSLEATQRLYVRPLSSATATRVPGTDGGYGPFWSPDGRQLGFVANRQLMTIDLSGGPPRTLCDLDGASFRGAAWGPDGTIVFSSNGVLYSARATTSHGKPQPLGPLAEGETGRFWPQFLPDGRRYLYSSRAPRREDSAVYVASLDSGDRTRIVTSDDGHASYSLGHLLFMRGGVLMAQRFDTTKLEVSGEAFPVSDQVALYPGVSLAAAYAASANGVLALRPGSGLVAMQLTWFDRSGRKLGKVGEPADYSNPALSPDERSLAVGRVDPQRKSRDLWIFDLVRGTSTRLTFDGAEEVNPTWSPDGTRIAFTSDRRGVREIYQKAAHGSGDDALVVESTDWSKHVEDWSPDGKYLLYNYSRGGLPSDLFLWPLLPGADRNPIPFVTTAFVERDGQFAPQGGWVAYCSNESGRIEVYVRRISPDGASGQEKWRVSTAGGITPQWRRDGKELFYVSGSTLMAADVKTGASFEAGMPKPLFEVQLSTESRRNHFVVSRDGQRFLVSTVMDPAGQTNEPIQMLVNWLPAKR